MAESVELVDVTVVGMNVIGNGLVWCLGRLNGIRMVWGYDFIVRGMLFTYEGSIRVVCLRG